MISALDLTCKAIRHVLDGNPPNGVAPGDCGDYAYLVETIYDAHAAGGTEQARRSWNATTNDPKYADLRVAIASGTTPQPDPGPSCPALPASAVLPADLGANACPWLDAYIAFSRRWSPRSFDDFHEATGIWLLSTIAARRVRLPFGRVGRDRYTSLYIALCARTSIFAKSTAVEIATTVLEAVGLSRLLAPDDATPQAFVKAFAARVPENYDDLAEQEQEAIKPRLAFAAQRGWVFDEFGMKLAAMMKDGGTMADYRGLLRKLDDGPRSYTYETISRGKDTIEAPYLALIASLTPADLKPYARAGGPLWGDGFFARFAFVTPPESLPRARGRFPADPGQIPSALTNPIRQWHTRLGIPDVQITPIFREDGKPTKRYELRITPAKGMACTLGAGVIDALYNYHDGLIDIAHDQENQDLDGNYARFADKALRMATLFASIENDGRIEIRHWARAQAIAERWRRSLHNLVAQVQSSEPSQQRTLEDDVIRHLHKLDAPTAVEVGRYLKSASVGEIETCLESLARSGAVTVTKTPRSKRYTLNRDKE